MQYQHRHLGPAAAHFAAWIAFAIMLTGCVVDAGAGDGGSGTGGDNGIDGGGCLSTGVVVDDKFDHDVTLNCPVYLIQRLEMTKGTLTIPKGTRLKVDLDGTMWISEAAAIHADGSKDAPIVIEGVAGVASRWRAFVIESIDPTNVLRFVHIRHGGAETYYTSEKAGLYLKGKAKVGIEDCAFSDHGGSGLFVESKASLTSFARNSFGAQDVAAVTVYTGAAPSLDAASSYGPAGNFVRVKGDNTDTTAPWLALDRPYRLEGDHLWKKKLALAAGAHLEVELGGTLWVDEDAAVQINGTATQPVRIVGAKALPGYWRAMVIESIDPTNTIAFLELRHGGSDTYYTPKPAGLTLKGKGKVAISDSVFAQNGGDGLYAEAATDLKGFARNSFEANSEASLRLFTPALASLDAASSYGKGDAPSDFVWVDDSPAKAGGTWPATNRPLRMVGSHELQQGDFVIAAGATLEFAIGATLWVGKDASLSAKATAAAPIELRGEKDIAEYWRAFVIESASPNNALQHVKVRNGGADTYYSSAKAGLYLKGKAKLALESCTFASNGATDLYKEAGASLTPADPKASNTFAGAVVLK